MLALVSPAPPSSIKQHPSSNYRSVFRSESSGNIRPTRRHKTPGIIRPPPPPPGQHPDYITSCFWICYPLYLVMCEAHNYKDYKESPPAVFNNDQLVFICETFPTCRVPVYMEGGGGRGLPEILYPIIWGPQESKNYEADIVYSSIDWSLPVFIHSSVGGSLWHWDVPLHLVCSSALGFVQWGVLGRMRGGGPDGVTRDWF